MKQLTAKPLFPPPPSLQPTAFSTTFPPPAESAIRPQTMCRRKTSSEENLSAPVPPAPRIWQHTRTVSVLSWRPTWRSGGQGGRAIFCDRDLGAKIQHCMQRDQLIQIGIIPVTKNSSSTQPATDGIFYNLSTTRRVRHPPPNNVQTEDLL